VGGVPVAYEVARALNEPLDVLVVRKLGVPGHEELAMGAIAPGGERVMQEEVVRELGISEADIATVASVESREVDRRERTVRGECAPVDVRDRVTILVDDGQATGATMRAATAAIWR